MVNQGIPKIIHYCWFGGNEKTQEINDLIEGHRRLNPDFEIMEWNESNFDLDFYPYAKEAYDAKRFAFVTDVVRLHVLNKHGGIYMDTDVESLKPFEPFLFHSAFTGCENDKMCVTGTMGAQPGNPWIKKLLSQYENKHFLLEDGSVDLTTNTTSITDLTTKEFGWEPKDGYQDLGDVVIYPSDYFCAKSFYTGKINVTENTVTIHHFKGSWKTSSEKNKSKILNRLKGILIAIFGEGFFNRVNQIRKKDKEID